MQPDQLSNRMMDKVSYKRPEGSFSSLLDRRPANQTKTKKQYNRIQTLAFPPGKQLQSL